MHLAAEGGVARSRPLTWACRRVLAAAEQGRLSQPFAKEGPPSESEGQPACRDLEAGPSDQSASLAVDYQADEGLQQHQFQV